MRIVNGIIFIALGLILVMSVLQNYRSTGNTYKRSAFFQKHLHLLALLFVANVISFALTYGESETEVYVERGEYGETENKIPFVLQKGEEVEEISLEVNAQQFTKEQLKERISEAFSYLEENMKGENSSLAEVRTALNYFLDWEQFPFDAEFVSEDYALIDGEGNIQNEKTKLLDLGYTEEEIEKGIPVNITVILWYKEESFEKIFPVVVYPEKKSVMEEQFAKVENALKKTEMETVYEEGFSIPSQIEGVQVVRTDRGEITPLQVLIAGVILTGLLLLREQENKRKEEQDRKESLILSYPWFVNEMVLLLGAGMQVRNIFRNLVQEYDEKNLNDDYRKPLIEEIKTSVHAMELGMTEEQAYYQLGRRLKLPCYIKLMTLLEQNVKRGAKGLTTVFEQEELSALEERKNLAKRYGEEAGTKLLGPMIILLLVVMLMIMIPAFMGFM